MLATRVDGLVPRASKKSCRSAQILQTVTLTLSCPPIRQDLIPLPIGSWPPRPPSFLSPLNIFSVTCSVHGRDARKGCPSDLGGRGFSPLPSPGCSLSSGEEGVADKWVTWSQNPDVFQDVIHKRLTFSGPLSAKEPSELAVLGLHLPC